MTRDLRIEGISAEKRALDLCVKIHEDQIDKDGQLHSEHCKRVALNMNDSLKPAAYLHDALEDTDLESVVIEGEFGFRTLELVNILTRRGESWDDYIRNVCKDPEAAIIKIYDIMDNLVRGGIKNSEKRNRYLAALYKLINSIFPS